MERVREFGVMRALGVRRRQVFALVMLESGLLSVLGTALGLALAVPLVLWLEGHPIPMTALSDAADDVASLFGIEAVIMFRLTAWHWGALPALLLVLALLASIPPALRACRGRPADALRTL
jgi:ABC-type lipoprotein release transport system permease subunit